MIFFNKGVQQSSGNIKYDSFSNSDFVSPVSLTHYLFSQHWEVFVWHSNYIKYEDLCCTSAFCMLTLNQHTHTHRANKETLLMSKLGDGTRTIVLCRVNQLFTSVPSNTRSHHQPPKYYNRLAPISITQSHFCGNDRVRTPINRDPQTRGRVVTRILACRET